MFAVRPRISQSRCRRKRNKTIGMCVKGSDPPGSLFGMPMFQPQSTFVDYSDVPCNHTSCPSSTNISPPSFPSPRFNRFNGINLGLGTFESQQPYLNDTFTEQVNEYPNNPCSPIYCDHKETELGEYGYITDPWEKDTDDDGWADGDEVFGTNHTYGIPSNPSRVDTDLDGVNDPDDIDPQHDLMAHIKAKDLPKALRKILEYAEEDDDADEMSPNLRGLVSIKASASDIELLLEYLVENKTGAKPYKLVGVTEQFFYLNLPDDIIELTPAKSPRQSAQGEINKEEGFVGAIASGALDAAGVAWSVVVAGAEFYANLVEAALEYGMEMLGTLWSVLGDVVSTVVEALGVLVEYIWGLIKQMFKIVFKPLLDRIDEWAEAIDNKADEILGIDSTSGRNSLTNEKPKHILLMELFALIFSSFMVSLIVAIGWTLKAVQELGDKFQTILSGGASKVAGSMYKVSAAFATGVLGLFGAAMITGIFNILYTAIPEESDIWSQQIGTIFSVSSLVLASLTLIFHIKKEIDKKVLLFKDVGGVILALMGLFMATKTANPLNILISFHTSSVKDTGCIYR